MLFSFWSTSNIPSLASMHEWWPLAWRAPFYSILKLTIYLSLDCESDMWSLDFSYMLLLPMLIESQLLYLIGHRCYLPPESMPLTGISPHALVKFIFMPKTFTNFLQKAPIMMWVVTFTAVCRSINNGGDCKQPILDNQLCIWRTKMCCIGQKLKIKIGQIYPYKNMRKNYIESKDKRSKNWSLQEGHFCIWRRYTR